MPAGRPMTLEDLLRRLDNVPNLGGQRLNDLKSAVRRSAKICGLGPGVPADPAVLRDRILRSSPAMVGLKPQSYRNLVSRLRKALDLANVPIQPGRHKPSDLTPEWRTLLDSIPTRGTRYGVSRLVYFASAAGWRPCEISEMHIERFRLAIEEEALIKHPKQAFRQHCKSWNKAVAETPGWPAFTIEVAERKGYTLIWSDFPSTIVEEIEHYLGRMSDPDPFDDAAPPRLARSTIEKRRFMLRQYLSALVHAGFSIDELDSLAAAISPDRLKQALRFFLERSGNRATTQIWQIATTVLMVARHWLHWPDHRIAPIKKIADKVVTKQKGLTEQNKRRLGQFDDPANIQRLHALPKRLMTEARAELKCVRNRAVRLAQSALAIEILLYCPIRARNLRELDLDHHFRRSTHGRGGVVHIIIPAEEVKNHVDLEFRVPDSLRALLDHYLAEFRAYAADDTGAWLFPGPDGGPVLYKTFLARLKDDIRRHAGLDMTPHLFRHLAAKVYLEKEPGNYEVMRRVLGHKSMDTTTRYYAGFETAPALRLFEANVIRIREGDDRNVPVRRRVHT